MMGLYWSLLGIFSGAFIALQAPLNAALSRSLGQPVVAAAASFVIGSVALIVIAWPMCQAQGISIAWSAPPLWMYAGGGLLGAAYVTSVILLTPRLGTAATMALIITGQLLAGLAIDRLGAFDFAVRELSLGRIGGAFLLIAGALLIRIS